MSNLSGYDQIEVTIEPVGSLSSLEQDWRALETQASASCFQGWLWIATWIQSASADLAVIRMSWNEKTVALGLFAEGGVSRPLGGMMPVIGLNEAPGTDLSRVAIEYNGLLCEAGLEQVVHNRLIDFLAEDFGALSTLPNWRECRLPGCSADMAEAAGEHFNTHRLYRKEVAPYVALSDSFARLDQYVGSLRKNTRHQLRRSLRMYRENGALSLVRPSNVESAIECMDRLIDLHQTQWRARGKPGAFSNEAFCAFHFGLIEKAFDSGLVDLVEVKVADQTIGILYNFIYAGVVSSYQSGFSYDADNRIKPGLVCHALAISDYASSGAKTYRFLAGGQRYKESLSNGADTLYWIALQRPDLRMRLENMVRQVKARFQMSQSK